MHFRFAAALALAVLISLTATTLEKRALELRRRIARQHYQFDVLLEQYAHLRLATQHLATPSRTQRLLTPDRTVAGPSSREQQVKTAAPLARWQRSVSLPAD